MRFMRLANNKVFSVFIFVLFSCLLFITACQNKCGSTTCQNGSTCTNNVCICPTGYSGNSCQTAWSDKYIGTYKCTRGTCTPAVTGVNTWTSAITKASTNGGYTVNISSFDNSITQVATVDSANNIKISPAAGAYGVSADGVWSPGKITFHYTTYSQGGSTVVCDMTMIKE